MTHADYREHLLPMLPQQPGVYRFISPEGVILYVGKAKNLKNRVSSYFREDGMHDIPKVRVLVKNAQHVVFTIVETEQDALLLESTLIKEHQPRYNVMLKDGKQYPYIVIKGERFPRVFVTRKIIKDGSTYFGPYTNANRIHAIMDMIKELFPLRTCTFNLSEENIQKKKIRVCLEYHIKNCAGPCAGLESEGNYRKKIEQIKYLLKGNFSEITRYLKSEMNTAAANLEFELAQRLKVKLGAFEDYQSKSTVVNPKIGNVDVFTIESDEKVAFVSFLKVANGAVINAFTMEMKKVLGDEEHKDLLELAIPIIAEKFQGLSPEVIAPFPVSILDKDTKMTVPQAGDKKALLDLSEKNAKYHILQRKKEEINQTKQQTQTEQILRQMQKDLGMDEVPIHLECFDNSNLQGTNPVSACVVFKNGRPSKKDYRHYNVKTVVGANDFATMHEVVTRRYKRLLAEGQTLPQLIIIDGGKGQLGMAVEALTALGILERVTVIGIAKRLEELYYPGESIPLMLDKKSITLRIIQQARDEAHRFGITFHRQKRSKEFVSTELTNIPGVGKATSQKLLEHFGSVKKLKEVSIEELTKVIGKASAAKVWKHFSGEGGF